MKGVTVVLGAMPRLFREAAVAEGQSVARNGKHLHIFVRHELQASQLNRDAKTALGRFSLITFFLWLLGVSVALSIGATILFFLGALDVFNQLFNKVVYSFHLPNETLERIYFIGILIGGAAILSFVPWITSGGHRGAGHAILSGLLNDDRAILRRLSARLGMAVALGRIDEVHAWNPLRFANRYRDIFLQLLIGSKAPVYLYLHRDELTEWTAWATAQGIEEWQVKEEFDALAAQPAEPGTGAKQGQHVCDLHTIARVLEFIWGAKAATCFGVLLLSSTRFAAEPWFIALRSHPDLKKGLVSLRFASQFGQQVISSEALSEVEAEHLFRTVFERACADYELFYQTAFYEAALLTDMVAWEQALPDGWRQLHQTINAKMRGIGRKLGDDFERSFL